MKNYAFLLLFWFVFNSSMGQNNLPEPILDFYAKYNFVNTFSTDKELTKLSFYLTEETLPPELSSDRLIRVHNYLKDINENLYGSTGMPNTTKFIPSSRMLGYLEIKDWEIKGDIIYIYTTSYHFEEQAKKYLINHYDQFMSEGNGSGFEKMFNRKKQYGNPVTQTWFKSDGEWKKASLNKILVNLN